MSLKIVPFRDTPQQYKAAMARAKADGRTFSGYVRHLIQKDLESAGPLPPRKKGSRK